MKLLLAFFLALPACGKEHPQTSTQGDSRRDDLAALYQANQDRAASLRDPATGWLAVTDCDGFIWSGKYASTASGVNMEAAEYPGEPGKFGRRPPPWCWTPELGDQGSKTEWSRDMATAGLLPWAWLAGRLDVLERHADYGRAHDWAMGAPAEDLRVYYTPELRGLLAKAIVGLGGEPTADALWPSLWASGLTDYEAHLQVMEIWLQGEIAQKLDEADAVPKRPDGETKLLDISDTMYRRLEEQVMHEPQNPLYQYVFAKYRDGNQSKTLDLLLDPSMPLGSYVRCADLEQCRLAEWLFVAHLLLSDFDALKLK